MYLRRRGKSWQARVVIKGYPEQLKSFTNEADALAWVAQVEKQPVTTCVNLCLKGDITAIAINIDPCA